MKNVTTFDNFPTFAENGSRNMNTESAKYQIGFVEADTFPAEWCNYLFHGATKGVSDLNTAVQSIWKENINVIQGSGQTPSSSDNTQLKTAIELMIQNAVLTANAQVLAQAKLDAQTFTNNAILSANAQVLAQAKLDAHPVGSLYWSSDPTDPSTLFGGTWVRIKDRFVLAVGDTYANGETGGSATVKLTESQLPTHKHSFTPAGTVSVTTNPTFTGSAVNTGGMSANSSGYIKFTRYTPILDYASENQVQESGNLSIGANTWTNLQRPEYNKNTNNERCVYQINSNVAHTHSVTASGTISGGAYEFTGTAGTTGNGGFSNTAVDKMPPYIVKYCWERTA